MTEVSTKHISTEEFLKLRPHFIENDEHPDRRPCPPWCWVVKHNPNGYEHEVEWDRVASKRHTLEGDIGVRASLYGAGRKHEDGAKPTASFKVGLEQLGSSLPFIRIHLRFYNWVQGKGPVMDFKPDVMKLTVEDACDLVTALEYLIDVATGTREPHIEHEECDCAESVGPSD